MAYIKFFLVAFALLVLSAHADYLYQAAAPGRAWWTWLDLTGRAAPWPWYIDWIPRDGWHIVQTIRNHAGTIGAVLSALVFARWILSVREQTGNVYLDEGGELTINCGNPHSNVSWQRLAVFSIIFSLICYGLARGIGFTLVKELMN